ncbi:MAG: tetratricopeptide repeat protein, partial [Thermoanaerobaculia bacterium]
AEAAAVLDELTELAGQPAIQRLTAEAKAKSGRWRQAEAIYRELWRADPADRDIAAALIDLYEDEDKLDEALAVLADLQHRDPTNSAVSERIVLDLARAGRFAEAEERARQLTASRPENRAGQRLLATVLFERGRAEEGEKVLRALIEADPDDLLTRRALASELVRERRFDEARKMYGELAKAAGEDPRKADTRTASAVELGFIAYLQKDWAKARSLLGPVALANGKVVSRAARVLLAVDRDGEDFRDGLTRAHAFAAADPREPEWAAAAGEFAVRTGQKAEGEKQLEALGASGDIDKMTAAADAYGRLKNYDAAVRIARAALAIRPQNAEVMFRLASSLERGSNPAEAEKVFLELLAERPNDAAAQNYLGYMWADKGVQLDRARELLEKAVAREPRNAAYLDSLGWVYFRLGKLDSAEKNLREAARREPSDPTISEHLGDLVMKQGDLQGAVRQWERALELKSEDADRVREKLRRARAPVSQR